jgi:hypothetical protein
MNEQSLLLGCDDVGTFPRLVPPWLGMPPWRPKVTEIESAGRPVRVVREPRQGNVYGRACGIKSAQAELIAFVDNDNFLYRDYLDTALKIATQNPDWGIWRENRRHF